MLDRENGSAQRSRRFRNSASVPHDERAMLADHLAETFDPRDAARSEKDRGVAGA
jgi:hypothetical protein